MKRWVSQKGVRFLLGVTLLMNFFAPRGWAQGMASTPPTKVQEVFSADDLQRRARSSTYGVIIEVPSPDLFSEKTLDEVIAAYDEDLTADLPGAPLLRDVLFSLNRELGNGTVVDSKSKQMKFAPGKVYVPWSRLTQKGMKKWELSPKYYWLTWNGANVDAFLMGIFSGAKVNWSQVGKSVSDGFAFGVLITVTSAIAPTAAVIVGGALVGVLVLNALGTLVKDMEKAATAKTRQEAFDYGQSRSETYCTAGVEFVPAAVSAAGGAKIAARYVVPRLKPAFGKLTKLAKKYTARIGPAIEASLPKPARVPPPESPITDGGAAELPSTSPKVPPKKTDKTTPATSGSSSAGDNPSPPGSAAPADKPSTSPASRKVPLSQTVRDGIQNLFTDVFESIETFKFQGHSHYFKQATISLKRGALIFEIEAVRGVDNQSFLFRKVLEVTAEGELVAPAKAPGWQSVVGEAWLPQESTPAFNFRASVPAIEVLEENALSLFRSDPTSSLVQIKDWTVSYYWTFKPEVVELLAAAELQKSGNGAPGDSKGVPQGAPDSPQGGAVESIRDRPVSKNPAGASGPPGERAPSGPPTYKFSSSIVPQRVGAAWRVRARSTDPVEYGIHQSEIKFVRPNGEKPAKAKFSIEGWGGPDKAQWEFSFEFDWLGSATSGRWQLSRKSDPVLVFFVPEQDGGVKFWSSYEGTDVPVELRFWVKHASKVLEKTPPPPPFTPPSGRRPTQGPAQRPPYPLDKKFDLPPPWEWNPP